MAHHRRSRHRRVIGQPLDRDPVRGRRGVRTPAGSGGARLPRYCRPPLTATRSCGRVSPKRSATSATKRPLSCYGGYCETPTPWCARTLHARWRWCPDLRQAGRSSKRCREIAPRWRGLATMRRWRRLANSPTSTNSSTCCGVGAITCAARRRMPLRGCRCQPTTAGVRHARCGRRCDTSRRSPRAAP